MQPKWDQHHGPTRKASKTWSQDRRWATPSPPKMDKIRQDPGRGVGGLRVQPLPRVSHQTRWLPGPVALQAVGLPPGASSVLKRIRTPTGALGARRLGLQEEGWDLGLGRWGLVGEPRNMLVTEEVHMVHELVHDLLFHPWNGRKKGSRRWLLPKRHFSSKMSWGLTLKTLSKSHRRWRSRWLPVASFHIAILMTSF